MLIYFSFFFFNDTATTEIYTLSLHDALPIFVEPQRLGYERPDDLGWQRPMREQQVVPRLPHQPGPGRRRPRADRKSTRLNSSHANISYAVFCLKKKNKHEDLHAICYHIIKLS